MRREKKDVGKGVMEDEKEEVPREMKG